MDTVAVGDLQIGDDHPPRIMGVLNVSPESPYDPSVYHDAAEAASYVEESLVAEGADIVDVGLESANKRSQTLSADEELDRLDLAVRTIERVDGDVVFSIETRYADVADEALSRGFDMVNDVCGFADPDMADVTSAHDAAVVAMASPPDLDRPGAVDDVDWATERSAAWAEDASYVDRLYASLERDGFTEKTIVDPAFGGWSQDKTLEDDRETLRRLREFRALDRPMLVSINRKNFLKSIVDRDTAGALPASLAATSMAVERGAHVIRTHDVAETRDAALVGREFARNRVRTEFVEERDVTNDRELRRHVRRVGGSSADIATSKRRAVTVYGLDPSDRRHVVDTVAKTSLTAFGTGPLLLVGPGPAFDRLATTLESIDGTVSRIAADLHRVGSNEKAYTRWD
ncbi:dihydropteroate synthase [Halanaeroarchaeum sulfurireducens]|nr:dihydropteroate synthase [Halanaeroarchaeum sulfurireducens]